VVLVHGLVVSSHYMVPTLKKLAAYHRVYAPDLPDFCESEKPRRVLDVTGLYDSSPPGIENSGWSARYSSATSSGTRS
jgi:2-hydroxy-6-oxonona-2,4-dienedioate hydrolase